MSIKNVISAAIVLGMVSFATVLSCKPAFEPIDDSATSSGSGGASGSVTATTTTNSVSSSTTSATTTAASTTSGVGGSGAAGGAGGDGAGGTSGGSGVAGFGGAGGSSVVTTAANTSSSSGELTVEVCDLKCPRMLPVAGEVCDGNLDQYCEYAQGACRSARCRVGVNVWEVNIMDPCVCYKAPSSDE